jgi:hypothetical protein
VPVKVANEIAPPDHRASGAGIAGTLLVGRYAGSRPPISLSIVYEPVESGWVQARIEGIPEVITAGPTKDAARELVIAGAD